MMKVLKEYNEMVLGPSWLWRGYSVLLVISMIIPSLWFSWSDITEYIKSKFKNHEEES